MTVRKFMVLLITAGALAGVASCTDAGTEPPLAPPPSPPDTISFSGFVLPTFVQYGCTGCHGGQNNLFVNTYANLMLGNSNNGPVITPGNGNGSVLIQKLRGTASFGARMPLGGPFLQNSTIDSIAAWINQGALNN